MTDNPEVLPCDIEAASDLMLSLYGDRYSKDQSNRKDVIEGRNDNIFVRAFAKHRTAAARGGEEQCTCFEAFGENPECILHGEHTDYGDDFGPIGDAARRICSYTERQARINVYKAAKRELESLYAHPAQPAPDTAKLIEALREAREALHFHYVEWDGEPEDAVPLQLARDRIDAILQQE